MDNYRVFTADDEPHSLNHLKTLLASVSGFTPCAEADNGTGALEILSRERFDLAFLDIGLPGMTGIEIVRELHKHIDEPPYVIFVTAFTHLGAEAFELGAVDYIVKPVSEQRLAQALDRFSLYTGSKAAGKAPAVSPSMSERLTADYDLTPREAEICLLVKEGFIRDEIKRKLNLSEATMKSHLGHIYDKTGLSEGEDDRKDKFSRLLYLLFTLD